MDAQVGLNAMARGNTLIGKFLRATPGNRALALEATVCLAAARLIVLFVPLRRIGRFASRVVRKAAPEQTIRIRTVKLIRWAVVACAYRVPWRALCYEQGLAAQFMLRRRGIASVLYYGVAPNTERGLAAHVWLRAGDMDVVGCDDASRHAILATFSSEPRPGG